MKDFSFNGKVYIGTRLASGKPGVLRWVDDASQLQIKLTTDNEERQESYSGNRLTSVRLQKAKKAEFSLTLNAFSKLNLALALYATPVDVTSGTVASEALPTGLVAGDIVALDHRDISALVIKDSAGTPATLVKDTDYSEESLPGGLVKIINVGTYVQPFTAAYSYAAGVRVPMFTSTIPEQYIVLDGINTVDGSRARVELFRGVFDPASQLDMITDALSSLQLNGSVLYDSVNAADANMGGFGRISLPPEA
ncbi:MAG TPA: hypothetical protein VF216_12200 [Mizugakiibacter sp.]